MNGRAAPSSVSRAPSPRARRPARRPHPAPTRAPPDVTIALLIIASRLLERSHTALQLYQTCGTLYFFKHTWCAELASPTVTTIVFRSREGQRAAGLSRQRMHIRAVRRFAQYLSKQRYRPTDSYYVSFKYFRDQ